MERVSYETYDNMDLEPTQDQVPEVVSPANTVEERRKRKFTTLHFLVVLLLVLVGGSIVLAVKSQAVDCDVGPWGGWTSCSASCGWGSKNRTREIIADAINNGEKCAKLRIIELAETDLCNVVCSPPVDCKVGPWGLWTGCSAKCGGGTKSRTRGKIADATNNGTNCASARMIPLTEEITCNDVSCSQRQVVVGGYDSSSLSSVEIFPRSPPSATCSIPDLPQARYAHSLSLLSGGRLVACGGHADGRWADSCISWVAFESRWTPFHTLSVARAWHTAWTPPSLPDSIVLLGGGANSQSILTAEIVPGGATFALSHKGDRACGIPDGETFILTGGNGQNFVTRYNVNGFVEELPRLPEESRYQHACSALPTQALVVAGGRDGSNNYLSSVLTLLPGATAWTPLASLPRTVTYTAASIVEGKMRVTGGISGGSSSRFEVLEYQPGPPDRWLTVGNLQVTRHQHAVLSIGPNQLPCL